jgi:hypothetical protein
MTNFRAAFHTGQDAAEKADLARKEIAAVFDEINEQLQEPTAGKVEIFRRQYEKEPDRGPFGLVFTLGPQEKYWAVAARNPKAADKAPRQLALWEQARSGYPCKVSWGNVDHNCNDRESLEACLASLLEDALVGEKIRGIMRLPEAKPTTDGTTTPSTIQ